jgi:hypothetical protein
MATENSKSTWKFILQIVSYVCTAIAGVLGGTAL